MAFFPGHIILACTAVIFLFLFRRRRRRPSLRLPPSPTRLPIIGNFHQLGPLPHRALQTLSKEYGPLMLLHLGSASIVVVSSAEAAVEVLKHQDSTFASRPYMRVAARAMYGGRDVVLSPYGEYWRRNRSVCVLHLLTSKKVRSFHGVMEEETRNMIGEIRGSPSQAVNLRQVVHSMTTDVMCRVTLGKKRSWKLMKLVTDLSDILGGFHVEDFFPWLGWINRVNGFNSRLDGVINGLDSLLDELLRERRDNNKEEEAWSFIDILLEYQRENNATIDDESIKAIILDMFIAGTDTTTSTIVWAMAELLKNPTKMERLQSEVRSMNLIGNEITNEDLENNRLSYLKAVIKETLRLHPPLPLFIPRESIRDAKVMGYDIEAKTYVLINAWAISNDPSFWESPHEFRPERFLEENAPSMDFTGQQFEFIPFSYGRRGCPGMTFAMAAIDLALAELVRRFDISPTGEVDMTEALGITVIKKHPLWIVARSVCEEECVLYKS